MNLGLLLGLGLASLALANEVPQQSIQQLQHTNQVEQHYPDSLEENDDDKRAWKDLSGAGWGKRGWNDLQSAGWGKRGWSDLSGSGWGKRAWSDLHGSGWGKRAWSDLQSSGWGKRAWSDLQSSGWGKRAWSDLQSSGWGKRAWKDLHGSGWGKRAWKDLQAAGWGKRSLEPQMRYGEESDDTMSLENNDDEKRAWNNLRGTWGKRADWSSFKGANEYVDEAKNE